MPAAIGVETLVNTTTGGDQHLPQIAKLAGGGFVIVWQDNSGTGGDASGYSIRAQRCDSSGAKLGPEWLVNGNTAGDQYEPKLTGLASGGFVITWTDVTGDASGWGVKARIYDASGSPVGGEFLVNTLTGDDQWQPVPEALPGGGFVITWAHRSGDASLYAVKGQIFDGSGSKIGSEFLVNSVQSSYQDNGKVSALAGGGFVVVWDDISHVGGDFSGYGVKGQLFDGAGSKVGGEFLVNTNTAGDQAVTNRSVSALSSGGFVVAWESNDPSADGSGYALKAQMFDSSGIKVGGEFLVNTNTAGHQIDPVTLSLPGGGFLISWADSTGDASGCAVKGQIFDASGSRVGGEFLINSATAGDQLSPMVASFGSGFAVVWADNSGLGGDASGFGVKLQLFSIANDINGTPDDDILIGTNGDDVINGLGGDDALFGMAGHDQLNGGDGDDLLRGDGNANYNGPTGNDVLNGGVGDDYLNGGGGTDSYDGGDGFDRISFYNRAATQGAIASLLTQTIANDGYGNAETMISIEALGGGTAYADHFTGDDNANLFLAEAGDTVIANGGDDHFQLAGAPALLDGGAGIDTIDAFNGEAGMLVTDTDDDGLAEIIFATHGVVVDLSGGTIIDDGFGNSGMLVSIENVGGSGLADTLLGDGGANILSGYDGNDVIHGGGGNDLLDGGGGNDLLVGGPGSDALVGGDGQDWAVYTDSSGPVGVDLAAGTASGPDGNDTLTGIENADGSVFDDNLNGNSLTNVLSGLGGNDTIAGFQGNDILDGGDGDDTVSGGQGSDLIHGGIGNDNLNGAAGDDIVYGDDGEDIVFGAAGNDTLYGGAGHDFLRGDLQDGLTPGDDYIDAGPGFDRVTYYNTNNAVTVSLFLQGAPQNTGQGMDTLLNVEAISGSVFSDTLIGDDNDNWFFFGGDGVDHQTITSDTISGNGGNDLIVVGMGNHNVSGGLGVDTLAFDWFHTEIAGGVTVDLALQGLAQDTGQGSMTIDGFENLSGTVFDDVLRGNVGNNLLAGSAGADTLYGGAGNDTLLGDGEVILGNINPAGAGPITTYNARDFADPDFYDSSGSIVYLFEGQDLYDSGGHQLARMDLVDDGGTPFSRFTLNSVDYDLYLGDATASDGVAGSDILFGGDGDDTLVSGAGNDSLNGGAGHDTIDGGGGIDTVFYNDAAGPVDLNLQLGFADEYASDGVTLLSSDTLTSIEYAIGSSFADALVGSSGDNYLDGLDGEDFIQGGGGNDQIFGSAGNDNISGDFGIGVLTGGGNDIVDGGDGNDAVRGRDGNDTVLGGSGNDFVEGGTGDDIVDGGAGFDRAAFYSMATAGVHVDLNIQGVAQNTGQGMDTLIGIENLSGSQFNDVLIGNGGDNWILAGLDGESDTVSGNAGNDLIEVGAGTHTLSGGMGIDTWSLLGNVTSVSSAGMTVSLALQGSAQNTGQGMMNASGFENSSGSIYGDHLTGDSTNNLLAGDEGADVLNGGDGNDTLYGDGRIRIDYEGTGGSGPITTWSELPEAFGAGAGNDTLNGGKGNDTLRGGAGDDVLTGGTGIDRFEFGAGSGHDRITDFEKKDVIAFTAGPHSFSELTLTAMGKDTLLTWGTGDSILIEGTKPNKLSAADFSFESPAAAPAFAAGDFSSSGAHTHFVASHEVWIV